MQTVHTHATVTERLRDERGVAIIIALLAMLLLTALGMAVSLTTTTERRISSNYRDGVETVYAADAAIERVIQDVLTVPDWNRILEGTATSSFVDGAPGVRALPVGGSLDLAQATAMIRCGKTSCSEGDIDQATDDRPWAKNNPRWQLYAHGAASDLVPTGTINSSVYVVIWIGDDPSENDDLPLIDGDETPNAANCNDPGDTCDNPGRGVVAMLAHAYGPGGVRRVIEATLARTDTTELERGYTGQRGQDEQNRRARKAAVQTPGKSLTRTVLTF